MSERILRQADFPADIEADPAAAQPMAFRLPLGQIKRVAERAQKLRLADMQSFRIHQDSAFRSIPSFWGIITALSEGTVYQAGLFKRVPRRRL